MSILPKIERKSSSKTLQRVALAAAAKRGVAEASATRNLAGKRWKSEERWRLFRAWARV